MEYIEIGKIVSVHGIKGDIKVYPWADYPELLEEFSEFYINIDTKNPIKAVPTETRVHKNMVLIKLDGIDSPEAARPFIEKTLYVEKSKISLDEGKYFIADLLGCKIYEYNTKNYIGELINVENFGASDVYTILDDKKISHLFPAVPEFIVSTDIKEKRIEIKVIEGMFSEN